MNFLAHIYLSGQNRELMIGNFIADYVKGNKKDSFPDGIRKGIELHRAIDDFTDHHPVTALSKGRLYARHHKYAGVVVDLFYDHFLAKHFNRFSIIPLNEFAAATYRIIESYRVFLPPAVIGFLPYMVEHDWLTAYASVDGIGRTLAGLGSRVTFPNIMHEAVVDLKMNYGEFEEEFRQFFPQLITFAGNKME